MTTYMEVVLNPIASRILKPNGSTFYSPPNAVIDVMQQGNIENKWVELMCVTAAPQNDFALPDAFPLKPLLQSMCDAPTQAMIRLKLGGHVTTHQVYEYLLHAHDGLIRGQSNGRYSIARYPWGDDVHGRFRWAPVQWDGELPEDFAQIVTYRKVKPSLAQLAWWAIVGAPPIEGENAVIGHRWFFDGTLPNDPYATPNMIPLANSDFDYLEELPESD